MNGNSKRDEDDFYGFAPDCNACVNSFVYGSDLRRIRIVGDSYATYEIVRDIPDEQTKRIPGRRSGDPLLFFCAAAVRRAAVPRGSRRSAG